MTRRETALNIFMGLVLLLAFAVIAFTVFGAAILAFYALGSLARLLLPGLHISSGIGYDLVFISFSVWYGIGHIRKQRRRNAFVAFAAISMVVSGLLGSPVSVFKDTFDRFPWFCLVLLSMATMPFTRLEFMLASFIIAATVAGNTGLLGSGTLAGVFVDLVWLTAFALSALYYRREIPKLQDPAATFGT